MAFVYWIKSPKDTDIFSQGYVGITSRTVSQRLKQHINLSKREDTPVNRLLRTGDYEVITICECSIEYAGYLENKLRPSEFIGLNRAGGGNIVKMTTEGRESVSKALRGVPKPKHVVDAMNSARMLLGVSDETRIKISKANKGRRVSDETRKKMSEARKLVKMPTRKQSSIERQVETFKNKHPLDLANVNFTVWEKCIDLYHLFKAGYSRYRAGKVFSFSKVSLRMMWVRFEEGFNPENDERISTFLNKNASYKV